MSHESESQVSFICGHQVSFASGTLPALNAIMDIVGALEPFKGEFDLSVSPNCPAQLANAFKSLMDLSSEKPHVRDIGIMAACLVGCDICLTKPLSSEIAGKVGSFYKFATVHLSLAKKGLPQKMTDRLDKLVKDWGGAGLGIIWHRFGRKMWK